MSENNVKTLLTRKLSFDTASSTTVDHGRSRDPRYKGIIKGLGIDYLMT